ncbi:MAG: alpha,alpha-trehalose-phosphate synthase (UDP-forming) [Gemmatimonadales bacterium]
MSSPQSPAGAVGPAGRAAASGRTLIVSNRLAATARMVGGRVCLQQSHGGLATGLRSVHEQQGGLWIGWSGLADGASVGPHHVIASRLRDVGAFPVPLSEEEVAGYYRGYSNGALWPVLHGCLRPPLVGRRDWERYRAVNERFADVVAQQLHRGDRVWIHDFHLMLLPGLLRARCPDARIGFFLHTPFPPAESFATLDQAPELLEGILGANLIGFHTRDYGRQFTAAVRSILGVSAIGDDTDPRQTRVFTCPMGIDVPFFTAWARKPAVITQAARIRSDCEGPLFVGIDRLDYTKGIVERLRAFERLLELEPSLRGIARLIQVAVPSREDASEYVEYRRSVEQLVTHINLRYGDDGWTPVDYRYGGVNTAMLVALYRAADVMLVTPVCDGMNLVAKEFVTCRDDGDGVLVLSSWAGAASELHAALLTDPNELDDLVRAYRGAIEMSPVERRIRMRHLRQTVERHDVFQWSKRFLDALGSPGRSLVGYEPGLTGRESPGLRLLH